jgi:hypothetical protein
MEISLTQGQVAIVDKEDFAWISEWKWYAQFDPKMQSYYAVRAKNVNGKQVRCVMHREIAAPLQGFQVDHINHNTLDNRRANLRVCSRAENLRNKQKRKLGASGFKGVAWCPYKKRWRADIMVDGKNIYLGRYKTPQEAASAYDEGARKYHGEFACVNA